VIFVFFQYFVLDSLLIYGIFELVIKLL